MRGLALRWASSKYPAVQIGQQVDPAVDVADRIDARILRYRARGAAGTVHLE